MSVVPLSTVPGPSPSGPSQSPLSGRRLSSHFFDHSQTPYSTVPVFVFPSPSPRPTPRKTAPHQSPTCWFYTPPPVYSRGVSSRRNVSGMSLDPDPKRRPLDRSRSSGCECTGTGCTQSFLPTNQNLDRGVRVSRSGIGVLGRVGRSRGSRSGVPRSRKGPRTPGRTEWGRRRRRREGTHTGARVGTEGQRVPGRPLPAVETERPWSVPREGTRVVRYGTRVSTGSHPPTTIRSPAPSRGERTRAPDGRSVLCRSGPLRRRWIGTEVVKAENEEGGGWWFSTKSPCS